VWLALIFSLLIWVFLPQTEDCYVNMHASYQRFVWVHPGPPWALQSSDYRHRLFLLPSLVLKCFRLASELLPASLLLLWYIFTGLNMERTWIEMYTLFQYLHYKQCRALQFFGFWLRIPTLKLGRWSNSFPFRLRILLRTSALHTISRGNLSPANLPPVGYHSYSSCLSFVDLTPSRTLK